MKRYGTFSGCGEYMNIVTLCGFGILAAVLCVIVRQIKPESAVFVSIAAGIGILAAVVTAAAPSVGAITELAENAGIDGEFTKVLLYVTSQHFRLIARETRGRARSQLSWSLAAGYLSPCSHCPFLSSWRIWLRGLSGKTILSVAVV